MMLLALVLSGAAASVASLALFAIGIGLTLVTLAAGAVVGVGARGLTVARTISHREAQEGDSIRLFFDVRGLGPLPVLLEVRDQSGAWVALGPAGATVELAIPRRGAYWLLPSLLRLRDAFGIFELRVRAGCHEELLILPAPDVSAGAQLCGRAAQDDQEPDGVGPYTPGTPLGRIHWRSLARGAGLQARHFSRGVSGMPLVVVDTAGAPNARALDWTARTAAGCVLTLVRDGGCQVLLPGDGNGTSVTDVDTGWRMIQRRLATLAPSGMAAAAAGPEHGPTIRVRAAAAPPGLANAGPLPPDVVPIATGRP
jgi:uncharacterized protein (DUF58 family)